MKDMTSPSIFTCQMSKKGIHYSSIQGHLLYSHTSPSPVKLNRVKMNRNSLGLNLKQKVVWNTLLCLKTSSDLQFLMCFIAKIEKALRGGDRFGGEEIDLEGRRFGGEEIDLGGPQASNHIE
ncbi:hypothetical protein T09_10090 [Trichinella sp. T9]|nr:hypothetical protein T09_10090 [Trichinella sp. T9]